MPDHEPGDDLKAEDKKVEHMPSKIRDHIVQPRDDIYRTPKFRNGRLPTHYQIFKGAIAPLKVEVRVPKLDDSGNAILDKNGRPVEEVKQKTIDYYDCMEVYQKALPGQGFARIKFQHKTEDILVEVLVPAFNENDGKVEERKHLQRLGFPYVESDKPLGQNTGIIHNEAARIFGFDKMHAIDGIQIGGGIFKGKEMRFKSLSKNAPSIIWEEEYLLAYGLDFYEVDKMWDAELFIRREEPENMALASKSLLQEEIREKYEEIIKSKDPSYDPKNLDNGNWIDNVKFGSSSYCSNAHMDKWKSLSREEKNALLVTTMDNAIDENDPSSYTELNSFKKVSFISRILKLNHKNKLGIKDEDFQDIFQGALEKKLPIADEFLEYSDSIDLSPAIRRYFTKALLSRSQDIYDIYEKYQKFISLDPEYINIIALHTYATSNDGIFKILIQKGAKLPTLAEAKKFSELKTYQLAINRVFSEIINFARENKVSEIKNLEIEFPDLFNSAMKDFDEKESNDRIARIGTLFSIFYTHEDTIKSLIEKLGDDYLFYRNKEGVSLLDRLISKRPESAKFFIEKLSQSTDPRAKNIMDCALFVAFIESDNNTLEILKNNGAKFLSETYATKLGIKKYFDAAVDKTKQMIYQHVRSDELKKLDEFEKNYPLLVKSAIKNINKENNNELLVYAARQCNMPMIKWLLKNGATTDTGNNQKFFDALLDGIKKTTSEKDIGNISQILENYKRELLTEDSGEIASRIFIEDLFKETKKINVDRLKELESKQPHVIPSLVHAKSQGISLLNLSLQHRDLDLFQWLMNHGAVFTDSLQDYFDKNNEYNYLKNWLANCIDNDDLISVQAIKECLSPSAFKEIIDTMHLVIVAANNGNINTLKFLIESGANLTEDNYYDLLYDFIKKSGTPKKVCDVIEYMGDSFEIDAIGVKSDVFFQVEQSIKKSDYESLVRLKKILNPEEWQEFLDRRSRKGNVIELMKNEPYFNEKIKAILYTKDLDASPLMSYSGTLFSAKKEDDKKSDESTLKEDQSATPKPGDR